MPISISRGPLGKLEKFLLILSTAAIVLTCYLFSLVSIVLLLLLVVIEIMLMLILLRFGLAGLIINAIHRHIALIGIFVRNLWLGKGVDYRLPLARDDAPKLFAMLDALAARFKIAPPHEVSVEMNCNAWVRMHGYRSGHGRTILGLGYDLLATLNLSEFEAVMAHEMAHAKLVKRGLTRWLNGGLARIARVSNALEASVAAYRAQKQEFTLAIFFQTSSDWMTRLTARLVSAYSRQDEFEADRGAAELCGASPLRTSLVRLEAVESRLGRLPWAERLSRRETEASFSQWLTRELIVPESDTQQLANEEARDPYSTHPSLHDRLAALPVIEAGPQDSTLALTLLSDPDQIAASLIEEIHRVAAVQEEKDFKLLAKAARKAQGRPQLNWKHLPGMLLVVLAVVLLIISLTDFNNWIGLVLALPVAALGVWLFELVRYKDRQILPVPRFAELKKAWQAPALPGLKEREKQIEAEFAAAGVRKRRQRMEFLLGEALLALGQCEYLRAHVASRIALQMDSKNVEAALVYAIASAALGMNQQVSNMLIFIRKKAGLSSPQIVWGTAWALTLLGDWNNAEAFLWKKHLAVPDETTFSNAGINCKARSPMPAKPSP